MNPSDLPAGTVVRWRTRSNVGVGQIDTIDPDGTVTVRAWLPSRSQTIRTTLERITVLADLNDATQHANRTAQLLTAGLR